MECHQSWIWMAQFLGWELCYVLYFRELSV
jgi:hypothetical protein